MVYVDGGGIVGFGMVGCWVGGVCGCLVGFEFGY